MPHETILTTLIILMCIFGFLTIFMFLKKSYKTAYRMLLISSILFSASGCVYVDYFHNIKSLENIFSFL